jgi:hypothetical protein
MQKPPENTTDGNEVTHAECRACNSVQPVIWSHFDRQDVVGVEVVAWFRGMEAKCESCGFAVAKIGRFTRVSRANVDCG